MAAAELNGLQLRACKYAATVALNLARAVAPRVRRPQPAPCEVLGRPEHQNAHAARGPCRQHEPRQREAAHDYRARRARGRLTHLFSQSATAAGLALSTSKMEGMTSSHSSIYIGKLNFGAEASTC